MVPAVTVRDPRESRSKVRVCEDTQAPGARPSLRGRAQESV